MKCIEAPHGAQKVRAGRQKKKRRFPKGGSRPHVLESTRGSGWSPNAHVGAFSVSNPSIPLTDHSGNDLEALVIHLPPRSSPNTPRGSPAVPLVAPKTNNPDNPDHHDQNSSTIHFFSLARWIRKLIDQRAVREHHHDPQPPYDRARAPLSAKHIATVTLSAARDTTSPPSMPWSHSLPSWPIPWRIWRPISCICN